MPKPNFEAVVSSPEIQAAAVSDTAWRGQLDLAQTVALQTAVKTRSDAMAADYAIEGCRALQAQMLGLEQTYSKFMINAAEAKDPKQAERWLGMALRCQEQYRKSLATIHEVKNPTRTQFVKTYIEQQLNRLEIGEATNGRMDSGTAATCPRADSADKTLVELDGASHAGRQGNLF